MTELPTAETATLAETDAPSAPDGLGLQLGGYVLVRQLGHGSMGVIYEARQPGTGRPVALKTINRALLEDADVRTRFAREAEAAASLDHASILPVYEVGEEDGRPFFTMKLAEGGSLLKAMPRYAGRPREAVELMAKVARGIAHAHGRGVLHRDLKPGNVLLDLDGVTPLVSDFGLARWLDRDSDLTQSLVVFGTPGYMAPEQARHAGQAGPAADIYSMGAMLFQLLCGRTPFRGGNAIEVIEQARAGPAPSLRAFNPKAARDLETICARCLEFEPSRRPRCAADLAEDLERWLEGRPIRLRPVRLPERVWRWTARNPWLAGAAAGCVLLGGVAVVRHREGTRLKEQMTAEWLRQHSVLVLPLLDLDAAAVDMNSSGLLAQALRGGVLANAPSAVQPLLDVPANWSGTSNAEELRAVAKNKDCYFVLAGTRRRLGSGGSRVVLRLIDPAVGETRLRRSVDFEAAESLDTAIKRQSIGPAFHHWLAADQAAAPSPASVDPDVSNERARELVASGRRLMETHTIANLQGAMACFEDAIRLEPRSVSARAYLALACIGSSWVRADPAMNERAFRAATEAAELSPADPTVNRALCLLCTAAGRYEEALEHGYRSVEGGEAGERAFGQIGFALKILGHPDRAIRWFLKAKASENMAGNYDALLGDCYADLGDDELARKCYQTSDRLRSDLPDGWLGNCRLAMVTGDFPAARALYEARIGEHGGFISARQVGAQLAFLSRDFPAATRLYEEIRRQPPGRIPSLYGAIDSGSAYARLQMEENPLAARALLENCRDTERELLRQAPGNPEALVRIAAVEAIGGETSAALEHLRAAGAAGWLDHRSLRLDPRFDSLRGRAEFQEILDGLAARAADLRRRQPAG